jgi:hypothetical protein
MTAIFEHILGLNKNLERVMRSVGKYLECIDVENSEDVEAMLQDLWPEVSEIRSEVSPVHPIFAELDRVTAVIRALRFHLDNGNGDGELNVRRLQFFKVTAALLQVHVLAVAFPLNRAPLKQMRRIAGRLGSLQIELSGPARCEGFCFMNWVDPWCVIAESAYEGIYVEDCYEDQSSDMTLEMINAVCETPFF